MEDAISRRTNGKLRVPDSKRMVHAVSLSRTHIYGTNDAIAWHDAEPATEAVSSELLQRAIGSNGEDAAMGGPRWLVVIACFVLFCSVFGGLTRNEIEG